MANFSPTNQKGYFQRYINLVDENDLLSAFAIQQESLEHFLNGISEIDSQYRYAADKWSVKEILQHISDCERIFGYRALCIARGEKQPLPGFDENDYAELSKADHQTWSMLVEEFMTVRRSTWLLFKSLDQSMLNREGTANGQVMKAETIGFILLGHYYHHEKILKDRYLNHK